MKDNNINGEFLDLESFWLTPKKKDDTLTLLQKLNKILNSKSITNELSKYSKILSEEKTKGEIKIRNQLRNSFNELQDFLNSYNKLVKKLNKNKKVSEKELLDAAFIFNRIYRLMKMEINKIIFLKRGEITEENGVLKFSLNENELDNISDKIGIKNPYKEIIQKKEELGILIEDANKIFYETEYLKSLIQS